MINTLHVLFIGSPQAGAFLRKVPVLRSGCRFFVATSVPELSTAYGCEEIDVALFHKTFSLRELQLFAAFIRRRWPHAKILLILDSDEDPSYWMYDERIAPVASPELLLAAIERLAEISRQMRRRSARAVFAGERSRNTPTAFDICSTKLPAA